MIARQPTIGNRGKLYSFPAPFVAGVLDSSSYLAIILGISEAQFYFSILFIKTVLFLYLNLKFKESYRFILFTITLTIATLISSNINNSDIISPFQNIAVCFSIFLTLTMVGNGIRKYAKGVATSGFAMCATYIISVNLDIISYTGDRYHFFSGSHPNLGGELITAGVAMAVISLRPIQFLVLTPSALYCTFLMQSRTSTLAVLVAFFCFMTLKSISTFGWRKTSWGLLSLPVMAMAAFAAAATISPAITQEATNFVYDSVFLVDDQYRGGDSGFSGRDQHWGDAIGVIKDHLFFGAGPNFMERLGVLQPHNWILYALSQFGLSGLILVFIFIFAAYQAAKRDPIRLAVFIPLFIPWLLNDRSLNFNAYPFVLYICVFAPFQSILRSSGNRTALNGQATGKVALGSKHKRAPKQVRVTGQSPQ